MRTPEGRAQDIHQEVKAVPFVAAELLPFPPRGRSLRRPCSGCLARPAPGRRTIVLSSVAHPWGSFFSMRLYTSLSPGWPRP